jgi:hypothetical protein
VNECKERGLVAAVMGAKARIGPMGTTHDDHDIRKDAAERKKKIKITAQSFDRQVAHKMGGFFDAVFVPTLSQLIEAGLFYDEVEKALQIPSTWGATIGITEFVERAASLLDDASDGSNPGRKGRGLFDDNDDDDDDYDDDDDD